MIKVLCTILLLSFNSTNASNLEDKITSYGISLVKNKKNNQSKKDDESEATIKSEIDIAHIDPINVNDFKVTVDQSYIDNIISSAPKKKYPENFIRIIPNAYKSHKKNTEVEKPENLDTNYFLDSVVSSHHSNKWFAIINKKIYNNKKPGIENVFRIIEAGERFVIVKFFVVDNNDISNIKENKDNKHKYAEHIEISSDKKAVTVKLFIGQSYDMTKQRIFDGK